MKIKLALVIPFICCQLAAAQISGFQYISPKPHSILNSRETNIIIRQGDRIDNSSLDGSRLSVIGSSSGAHQGTLTLSDDQKTILFRPTDPYAPDETVTVTLSGGIRTVDRNDIGSFTFSFTTSPLKQTIDLSIGQLSGSGSAVDAIDMQKFIQPARTDSVPADLPPITVGTSNNPYNGKIFLANQQQTTSKAIGNYLMIFNNDGSVAKYKKISQSANGFKMEANGDPSYNLKGSGSRIILDTSFTAIDTIQGGNGYRTDGHDFVLLPNGHAIVLLSDPEPVDMSQVVPGGNPDATVSGLVVQEIDNSKNVIFQWRSWDYLPITASYFDLTQQTVDLLHANALAMDKDGGILVSIRHLSSIVKISR
jgi:hypothetical protein